MKIFNERVYGIKECLIASGYPMRSTTIEPFEDEIQIDESVLKRGSKLGSVPTGTGHDSYCKGIIVQFDIEYPVYWSPQAQRYHWFDIISSTSAMHRLVKLNLDTAFNEHVLDSVKSTIKCLVNIYNEHLATGFDIIRTSKDNYCIDDGDQSNVGTAISKDEFFAIIISNCPQGLLKTMRVNTNYLQLKTIYHQRKNHKLKEWRDFCNWVEKLPRFKELCLGDTK